MLILQKMTVYNTESPQFFSKLLTPLFKSFSVSRTNVLLFGFGLIQASRS